MITSSRLRAWILYHVVNPKTQLTCIQEVRRQCIIVKPENMGVIYHIYIYCICIYMYTI